MVKNILCFGDSLTAGYYNEGKSYHPYSKHLSELLGNVQVDHIGLSGWSTDEMLYYANHSSCKDTLGRVWNGLKYQLQHKKYDYCVILVGTNDLSEGENCINDLFKIHNIAHEEGCKTIALTIPQMKFESADPSITTLRLKINDEIKKGSSKLINKNMYNYIDISNDLPNLDAIEGIRKYLWQDDGLHLNPEGYDLIAKAVYRFLQELKAFCITD
jgi:lysophospholipase L1-like esterase